MILFVKKYLKHIVIAIITIAYFLISPIVQQRLALRASDLVVVSDPLPPLTQDARMYVDHLRSTVSSKGEYELAGWGFCEFMNCTDLSAYNRKILLVSDKRSFSIDTISSNRPDVENAFKDLNLNLMDVGYKVKILKDALPKGSYRIFLQFSWADGRSSALESDWSIIRSSNSIKLIRNDNQN